MSSRAGPPPARNQVAEAAARISRPADVFRRLAVEERDEIVDDLAVLVSGPGRARRRALADVAEQAGRPTCATRLNTPAEQLAPEDPRSCVERLADRPGMRVRAEAERPFFFAPRMSMARGNSSSTSRPGRVALVVAIADVEARVELLDPGVLKLEYFDLGAHPVHSTLAALVTMAKVRMERGRS